MFGDHSPGKPGFHFAAAAAAALRVHPRRAHRCYSGAARYFGARRRHQTPRDPGRSRCRRVAVESVMTIEGLGKKFQDARLARGLTLDEAARLTKIRPSRLAEIEADDFSQFPSLAYAKGFLLIYGKFLDVDVTPYLDVFETSREVTVDGYSYLQDQPAPKPRRVRPTRAPVVRRERRSRDRSSPFPILIAVGVIVLGFILMR